MKETKPVTSQLDNFQLMVNDLTNVKINLPKSFVAALLIEKLPPSWKDYKNNLKQKEKGLYPIYLWLHHLFRPIPAVKLQPAMSLLTTSTKVYFGIPLVLLGPSTCIVSLHTGAVIGLMNI